MPLPIEMSETWCFCTKRRAQCVKRLGLAVLRRVRVDRDGIDQLAGGVDHGHLAAGAEAGVDAEDRLAGERRLAEQAAQIGGKDRDGVAFGQLGERVRTSRSMAGRSRRWALSSAASTSCLAQGERGSSLKTARTEVRQSRSGTSIATRSTLRDSPRLRARI